MNLCIAIFLIVVASGPTSFAADDLTAQLQKGLIEEEANHNLVEAIKAYQNVASQFDKDRKLAATAIFRLAECFRKQGNTNEAAKYYDRIVREFSDQTNLVAAVRQVDRNATKRNSALPGALSLEDRLMAADTQFSTASTQLSELKKLSTEKRRIAVQKILTSTVYDGLLTRLLELERNIASSDPELSPDHPKRKAMDIELKVLETQIDDQVEAAMAALATEQSASGSVFRNLRMQQREFANRSGGDTTDENGATEEERKELERLKALLRNSPDLLNKMQPQVGTPLQNAAVKGYSVVTRFLLTQKVEVNGPVNAPPLVLAAANGHRGVVELLLNARAEIDRLGNTHPYSQQPDVTPLTIAAKNGYRSVVELLLERGATVQGRETDGSTALHQAARGGNLPIFQTILSRASDVNVTNVQGETPLHLAAAGNSNMVKLLLDKGAEVNLTNSTQTPLEIAAIRGQTGTVALLLERGAAIEAANRSALFSAISATDVGSLQLLLSKKPKLEFLEPNRKVTPLQFAILLGKMEAALELLEAGANPKVKALQSGNFQQPNFDYSSSDSVLHWAVRRKDDFLIKTLLSKGADPNVPDKIGYTPLMIAALVLNAEAVELLLKNKADPNIPFPDGQTALDLVRKYGGHIAYNQTFGPGGALPPTAIHTSFGAARTSSKEDIEKLLIAGGAKEVRRQASISVMRKGLQSSTPIFQRDAENLNRFTLMELVAEVYASQTSQGFEWPKLSALRIHHFDKSSGPGRSQTIDLEKILENGDCTKDIFLQWGDVVEIPEEDHSIAESWGGFPPNIRDQLRKCLERNIQVIVKGNATPIRCWSRPQLKAIGERYVEPSREDTAVSTNLTRGFWLRSIIHASNLLRTSSDLKNIRVYRPSEFQAKLHKIVKQANAAEFKLDDAVKEGRYLKITVDISQDSKEQDLWVRDGDIIEIPEKE